MMYSIRFLRGIDKYILSTLLRFIKLLTAKRTKKRWFRDQVQSHTHLQRCWRHWSFNLKNIQPDVTNFHPWMLPLPLSHLSGVLKRTMPSIIHPSLIPYTHSKSHNLLLTGLTFSSVVHSLAFPSRLHLSSAKVPVPGGTILSIFQSILSVSTI